MRSIGKLFGGAGLACLILTLAGCGAQGEEFQPRPVRAEKSVVYIYRPYKTFGSRATPMVTCGGESIEMEPGGFYSFDQNNGTVTCTAASETTPALTFEVRPGEQYFVREDLDAARHFTLVNATLGSEEIKDCRRQGIKQ